MKFLKKKNLSTIIFLFSSKTTDEQYKHHIKLKTYEQHGPTKKQGVDSGAPEESAVSASCRTPTMLSTLNPVCGRDNIKVTGPFSFGKRVLYACQILTGRIMVYKCLSVGRKHVAYSEAVYYMLVNQVKLYL